MARLYAPQLASAVATEFLYDGKKYARGEPFPHRELGLHDTTVRGLWLAYLIDFVVPPATVATKPNTSQQAKRHERT